MNRTTAGGKSSDGVPRHGMGSNKKRGAKTDASGEMFACAGVFLEPTPWDEFVPRGNSKL